jgi:hypothetical protein
MEWTHPGSCDKRKLRRGPGNRPLTGLIPLQQPIIEFEQYLALHLRLAWNAEVGQHKIKNSIIVSRGLKMNAVEMLS